VRLDTSGELCFLLSKHANDTSSNFVMNYGLVIFADDVDTERESESSESAGGGDESRVTRHASGEGRRRAGEVGWALGKVEVPTRQGA
jgi:hypothetical protein